MSFSFPLLLLLCLMGLSLQAQTVPANKAALVIGNARYEPLVGPLRNTSNDAKAMAKTLRSLGFTVIEKHNVTRDQLIKAVLEFRQILVGAEVGIFYFAGHGISIAGANYLIPLKSGYSPEGADDVTLRMLAETRLFNVEQMVADMSTTGTRCNLIILDACRTTALARTGRTRDVTSGGLSEMQPPAGSLIAFATDAGQTALDGDGEHGLYTSELLKYLQTPGLTIEQVFKRTRAGVLQQSQGGQIPAEYSRLIGEDIYLAGPLMATPVLIPAPVPAPAPAPIPMAISAETDILLTPKEILTLAKEGKVEECVQALKSTAEAQGPGGYSAEPLTVLLEQVKEDLKEATEPTSKIENAVHTCVLVLQVLPQCLAPNHKDFTVLRYKAHNRHGDALLALGLAEEALVSFNLAAEIASKDAYIFYNRGRAYEALGKIEEAKAAFKTASDLKFNQPKARKLAQEALMKLK